MHEIGQRLPVIGGGSQKAWKGIQVCPGQAIGPAAALPHIKPQSSSDVSVVAAVAVAVAVVQGDEDGDT